ncbi:hypothetical protein ABK040_009835 [Willaertia magna]
MNENKPSFASKSNISDSVYEDEKKISDFLERKFPEWKDDKQMIFFMGNFKRTRQVNTSDWDNRLNFWKNVLLSIISEYHQNKLLVISVCQLKKFMSRRKKLDDSIVETTLGWQTIIHQMIQQGELMLIEEFKKVYDINNEQGIGTWLIQLATNWIFGRKTTSVDIAQNDIKISDDEQYIAMKPVREITMNFIRNAINNKIHDLDLYFSPTELRELYFSEYDLLQLDLLLNYMHCEETAIVIEIGKSKKGLRCFENKNIKKESLQKLKEVLEKDSGILQLKEMNYILDKQIDKLQLQITNILTDIKSKLLEKKRDEAKYLLKKKHLLEDVLEKRTKSKENIYQLLSSIESSKSAIEVLESLSFGSNSLKLVNKEIKEMKPEETLEEITNTLADYKEIQDIMDMGMKEISTIQGGEIDEDELSKELERMSLEDKKIKSTTATTFIDNTNPSVVATTDVVKEEIEQNNGENTFPTTDDIPVESTKILQFEKENNPDQSIVEYCILKLKMLSIKKKMKKVKNLELIETLKQKMSHFEQLKKDFEEKGEEHSVDRVSIYIQLLTQEIDSLVEKESEQHEEEDKQLLNV